MDFSQIDKVLTPQLSPDESLNATLSQMDQIGGSQDAAGPLPLRDEGVNVISSSSFLSAREGDTGFNPLDDTWKREGFTENPDTGFIDALGKDWKLYGMRKKADILNTASELMPLEGIADAAMNAKAAIENRQDLATKKGQLELLMDGPTGWGRLVGSGLGMITYDIAPSIALSLATGGAAGSALMAGNLWASTYGNYVDEMRQNSGDVLSEDSIKGAAAMRSLIYAALFTGVGAQAASAIGRTVLGNMVKKSLAKGATPFFDGMAYKTMNWVNEGLPGGAARRFATGYAAGAVQFETIAVVQRFADQLVAHGFDERQGMSAENLRIVETIAESLPLSLAFGSIHAFKAMAKKNAIDVVSRVTGKTGDEIENGLNPTMRQAWLEQRKLVLESLVGAVKKGQGEGAILSMEDAVRAEKLARNMALASFGINPSRFTNGPVEIYSNLAFRFKKLSTDQMKALTDADAIQNPEERSVAFRKAMDDAGLTDVITIAGDRADLKGYEEQNAATERIQKERIAQAERERDERIKNQPNRVGTDEVYIPDATPFSGTKGAAGPGRPVGETKPTDVKNPNAAQITDTNYRGDAMTKIGGVDTRVKVVDSAGKDTLGADTFFVEVDGKPIGTAIRADELKLIPKEGEVAPVVAAEPVPAEPVVRPFKAKMDVPNRVAAAEAGNEIVIGADGKPAQVAAPKDAVIPLGDRIAQIDSRTRELREEYYRVTNDNGLDGAELVSKRKAILEEHEALTLERLKLYDLNKAAIDEAASDVKVDGKLQNSDGTGEDAIRGAYTQTRLVNGAAKQTLRTIWLFQHADAGTIVHEFMHHMIGNGYIPEELQAILFKQFGNNEEAMADSLLSYFKAKGETGDKRTKASLDFLARTFQKFYKNFNFTLDKEVKGAYDKLFLETDGKHGTLSATEVSKANAAYASARTSSKPENDVINLQSRMYMGFVEKMALPGKVEVEYAHDGKGRFKVLARSPYRNGGNTLDISGEVGKDGSYRVWYTNAKGALDQMVFPNVGEFKDAISKVVRGELDSLQPRQLQMALQNMKKRDGYQQRIDAVVGRINELRSKSGKQVFNEGTTNEIKLPDVLPEDKAEYQRLSDEFDRLSKDRYNGVKLDESDMTPTGKEALTMPKPEFAGTKMERDPIQFQKTKLEKDWDVASSTFHKVLERLALQMDKTEAEIRAMIPAEIGPGHASIKDALGNPQHTSINTLWSMMDYLKRQVGDETWMKSGIEEDRFDLARARKASTNGVREGLINFIDSLSDRLNIEAKADTTVGKVMAGVVRYSRKAAAASFDTETIIDMIHGGRMASGPLDYMKALIHDGNVSMQKIRNLYINKMVVDRLTKEEEGAVGRENFLRDGSVVNHMNDRVEIAGISLKWQEALHIWRVANGGEFMGKDADGRFSNSILRQIAENRKLTDAQIAGAVEFVRDNKGLRFFDDIMSDVYGAIYEPFNTAWKKLFNPKGIGEIRGKYVPHIRDFRAFENGKLEDLVSSIDPAMQTGTEPASGNRYGKARSEEAYRGKISLDAYDGFFAYIDHVANYLAKAENVQKMIDVVDNEGVRGAFYNKFGDYTLLDTLRDNIAAERSLTGRTSEYGLGEKTLQEVRRRASYAMMGGNPFSIPRQITSLFTSAALLPNVASAKMFGNFAYLFARTAKNMFKHIPLADTKEMSWALDLFPDLRGRIIGSEMEYTRKSANEVINLTSSGGIMRLAKDAIFKNAVAGIRATDQAVVLSVLKAAYESKFVEIKEKGGTLEAAHKEAKLFARDVVNQSNDPTSFTEMSKMQRSNEYVKTIIPFSGFNFKFWQLLNRKFVLPMVYAWRNDDVNAMARFRNGLSNTLTKDNARMAAIGIVAPALFMGMIMRKRMPKDGDEVIADVLQYPLSSIPLLGGFIAGGMTGFNQPFGNALWQSLGDNFAKLGASTYREVTGEDGNNWMKDVGKASAVIGTATHMPAFYIKTITKTLDQFSSGEHADTISTLQKILSAEPTP